MISSAQQVLARDGVLTAIYSTLVFCVTWPLITLVTRWVRIYLRVLQLPGPPAHPLLGNYELFNPYSCFQLAAKWRDEFPGFHKAMLVFYPFIIAQTPDAVQAIISHKHRHNEKSFPYLCLKALFGNGLITSKGEQWHKHRKLITPAFHLNILESFVEVFVRRTEEFIIQLDIVLAGKVEGYVDVSHLTRKLTLDLICETALGIDTDGNKLQHAEVIRAMNKLEETSMYRVVRPWLLPNFIFRLTKRGRDEKKYENIFSTFTDQAIKERKLALSKEKESKYVTEECYLYGSKKRIIFIDLLITSSEGGTLLSDKNIREEVQTFIMAGQNTTHLAINYCLYLLGENPDIQAEAYKELCSIFGESDRRPTMADLKSMKYLGNCIKDALRLFPSVPVFGRTLTEDQEFGKVKLPKGVDVAILPYVLHRDPAHFPDPEKFNPDNFLPEVVKKRHPYAYIPFSAGPRNCIGQKYALLVEKTVLSAILRRYLVKSLQSRQELIVVPITVLVPKTKIKLMFTPRKT